MGVGRSAQAYLIEEDVALEMQDLLVIAILSECKGFQWVFGCCGDENGGSESVGTGLRIAQPDMEEERCVWITRDLDRLTYSAAIRHSC